MEPLCWDLLFSNAEKNIPQQNQSPMNSLSRTQQTKQPTTQQPEQPFRNTETQQ